MLPGYCVAIAVFCATLHSSLFVIQVIQRYHTARKIQSQTIENQMFGFVIVLLCKYLKVFYLKIENYWCCVIDSAVFQKNKLGKSADNNPKGRWHGSV